jgi:hypothetical protein
MSVNAARRSACATDVFTLIHWVTLIDPGLLDSPATVRYN